MVTSSALLFPADGLLARILPRLVPKVVSEAQRIEDLIRAPGLDWTIARTSFLTNDNATGYRLASGALPERAGAISRAAVAHFLLTEAKRSAYRRQVVGLCG